MRGECRRRLEEQRRKGQLSFEGVLELIRKLAHADIRMAYRPDGSLKAVHDFPDDLAARIAGLETEERLSVNGLDLDEDVLAAVRAALAAVGVTFEAVLELQLVRVRKVKWWDPAKAADMLGRYHKMFGNDAPPALPPILQLPEDVARRLRPPAPGDDAVDITPPLARASGVREGSE